MKKPIKDLSSDCWLEEYIILYEDISTGISKTNFAENLDNNRLPFEIFVHKTTLLKKLKDIDMWMQHNKVKNLNIAIQEINGLIVEPRQTFSYWRQTQLISKCKLQYLSAFSS